ncbi:PREDICTED: RNA polymerase II C-terminal domain phosphatase-like 4 [Fragaria vesca subsp. vesca]|uniref:RNA polymerase II C-terminal domain phosphatase-like 4 n=1 Tax=Fragaria vesca subsp. vesca TaxID=101020 RepID=UPI0002C348B4|nr:PREDICTED: RNA polymerase II C-terminal domain phosphatase-like 4 [Fragaria vesca subsp. vesca]XP_011461755.1 PREDICTED: RNA polymerase II C-terminal domain phosphatase-like 4 [Fragaria vesca subsp. vesca]
MSLAESPVHSSSSDGFAGFLETELESGSSESSPDEECKAAVGDDDGGSESSDVESESRVKRRKVENVEILEEANALTSQAVSEEISEASGVDDLCAHPGSFGDMCFLCGQRLIEQSGVTFGYIHKGLRLNDGEIDRLRNTDIKKSLNNKKLYLVLDLDHTLLNTTLLNHVTAKEEYLMCPPDSLPDVLKDSLFRLDFMRMMTKLRPFIRTFLKEASEIFEMYIYTMGDRAYALEMAKLLDPKKEYFGDRVISRDDGTQRHQKGLDIVLGQESAVLILDDTENAWIKHKDNLILMERYHFFRSSCAQFGFTCESLSELKSDESEPEGALANVLDLLKRIHKMFFYDLGGNLVDRDVRQVLKIVRKEVLNGCKVVFSRIIPSKVLASSHHLWKMAEQLGAICSTEVDSTVTHVVALDAGTEKSRWAVKHNKFLVHPRWLEAANYMWQKQAEEKFPVTETKMVTHTE